MQTGGVYDVDVRGAWKALSHAGKTTSKPILIAVLDNGFGIGRSDFTEQDLDVAVNVNGSGPNAKLCGKDPCPWHGANVAEAAAGIADDTRGAAGTGAPVARIVAIDRVGGLDGTLEALKRANAEKAPIVIMSFAGKVERGRFFSGAWPGALETLEKYTVAMNDAGHLLFAAAGNSGENIDAVNEDGDEAYWHYPCENQAVRCVGGWEDNPKLAVAGKMRALGSNYSMGKGEVVDIWGPWCALVGDTFDQQGPDVVNQTCGTSIASPMVAGVAALIWAGNTSLSNHALWDLMHKHAIPAGSIRRVHAYRAVREAIMSSGVNTPPAAEILSPTAGAKLSQGGDLLLVANVYDVEDEKNCCTISWSVNGAPAATGNFAQIKFANPTLGAKTITATVTDSAGGQTVRSVEVILDNSAPKVSITIKPTENLTQGLPYAWRAEVVDDSSPLALPSDAFCPSITWTSTLDPGVLAHGCDVQLTFNSPGLRTLTASYTDAYGMKGSASVPVNVAGSSASKIVAVIQWPKNGFAYWADEEIPLEWATNGNASQLASKWTLTNPATGETKPIPVTVAENKEWFRIADVFPNLTFSSSSPELVLTLTLTGAGGKSSAPVSVKIVKLAFIK
jgi:serine protease